ncbi:MAG TPA: carbohydrate-binding protein, partial [Flavisolibacter sp.]|nr:carbohydrate-binding protein [Flavisolibacter sp.]
AESYTIMSGVVTQPTTDIDGMEEVSSINTNDWMDYSVNLPYAGTYTASFRVAASQLKPNSQFQLRKADGTILATIKLPNTGNLQTWQTVSVSVNLPQGIQILRIYGSKITSMFNLNWWELHLTSLSVLGAPASFNAITDTETSINIYPNPVNDQLLIRLSNSNAGAIKIEIVNIGGVITKELKISNGDTASMLKIDVTDLSPGIYILRMTCNAKNYLQRFIKL